MIPQAKRSLQAESNQKVVEVDHTNLDPQKIPPLTVKYVNPGKEPMFLAPDQIGVPLPKDIPSSLFPGSGPTFIHSEGSRTPLLVPLLSPQAAAPRADNPGFLARFTATLNAETEEEGKERRPWAAVQHEWHILRMHYRPEARDRAGWENTGG